MLAGIVGCGTRADREPPTTTDRPTAVSAAAGDAGATASALPAVGDAGGPPPPAVPPPPPTLVVSQEVVTVNGTPRSYVLVTPSTYTPAASYPLVIALHGDGRTGEDLRADLAFEEASGQGALVAYPTGMRGRWNLYEPDGTNPDMAFLALLVDSLRARFTIDPGRIFAFGISSGAFMVSQVACRRSSLFRAIAPHSGGAPSEPRDPGATTWGSGFVRCVGQDTGVAAIVIHGEADDVVPKESGRHAARYWAHVGGCATTTEPEVPPSPCVAFEACPVERPVRYCRVPGLGHSLWPEAASTAWGFFSGFD